MLSDEQIEAILGDMETNLTLDAMKRPVELCKDWKSEFPDEAGVYAVWEEGEDNPVYVGETGNISARMEDLRDSRHHTLRRNIGEQNFSSQEGYRDATTTKKFPPHIEQGVDSWLARKTTVSVLPTKLGRKELEERIYERHKPKYNKKGQRKSSQVR